jgi:voltage-gated sodium channel
MENRRSPVRHASDVAVPRRNRLARLVDSTAFAAVVLAVIVANAVVLGLQTYDELVERYGELLDALNDAFLAFFVVELVLRMASYGRRPRDFFRSGWNVFDFVIIGAAFVPGLRENSTLLRLVRLLRVVRVVRLLPDLRILLQAVARSLPPLGSMVVLTTLILFVYGMVGWVLFGEDDPENWGDIGRAMLTLFVLLTLENFPVYLERGMEIHTWSWIYFVSFALVAVFIVLNVLIGIVLNSMEEARRAERRRVEGASVAELIAEMRAALDDLEHDLMHRKPGADARRE